MFRRLVMGMRNSTQSFQRWVDSVIRDLLGVFAYMDDILIFSKDEESHKVILAKLFKRLENAGLTIFLKKSEFGVSSLDYLGYRIDDSGISPLKKKIEALDKFPAPSKQKECLTFLGSLNHYRALLPWLSPHELADYSHTSSRQLSWIRYTN